MPLEHVQPSQRIKLSARAENMKRDAANWVAANREGRNHGPLEDELNPGVCQIKNATGSPCDRFTVFGFSDALIRPDENANHFRQKVALVGRTPTSVDIHRWAVSQIPLDESKTGPAVVSGATPVLVEVTEENQCYTCVAAIPGDNTKLTLVEGGRAQVLWKEDGLGVKEAYVQLSIFCGCRLNPSSSPSSSSPSSSSPSSPSSSPPSSPSSSPSSSPPSSSPSSSPSAPSSVASSENCGEDPCGTCLYLKTESGWDLVSDDCLYAVEGCDIGGCSQPNPGSYQPGDYVVTCCLYAPPPE